MSERSIVYPVKILFLAVNPRDTTSLRLDREMRAIDEQLRHSPNADQFQIEQRWAVRTRDLMQALLDVEPQIVHFCGHGEGTIGLVFEDETGSVKLVGTKALANLYQPFAEQVKCVLLNACYAEVQADAIVQHIDYAIGMRKAVQDDLAIAFSKGFYWGIGMGRSIEDAFHCGCDAIQKKLAVPSVSDRKLIYKPSNDETANFSLPEHLIPVLKRKVILV